MLGWILLAIGVAGFGLGAYWDLKTTEFPDWLPYSMIAAALVVRGGFSLLTGDLTIIIDSVVFGLIFLGAGLLMYLAKQWGDGDAWLLGALGFLFPDPAGFSPVLAGSMPFAVTLIFNFFLVSLAYLFVYAFFLGIRSPAVFSTFRGNMKSSLRMTLIAFIAILAVSLYVTTQLSLNFGVPFYDFTALLSVPFLTLFILVFLQYARAVESDLFKRRIDAKDLRAGDVIITDKWRGITEEEAETLRKKGGKIWVKEGVRFAPAFVITIIVTLFVGSLASMLFPLA